VTYITLKGGLQFLHAEGLREKNVKLKLIYISSLNLSSLSRYFKELTLVSP